MCVHIYRYMDALIDNKAERYDQIESTPSRAQFIESSSTWPALAVATERRIQGGDLPIVGRVLNIPNFVNYSDKEKYYWNSQTGGGERATNSFECCLNDSPFAEGRRWLLCFRFDRLLSLWTRHLSLCRSSRIFPVLPRFFIIIFFHIQTTDANCFNSGLC